MARWVELFDIFLNSPSAEGDAARWFQAQTTNSAATPPPTAAFLSFLLSPSPSPSLLFVQTLPLAVQCRILSFLAAERHRFCGLRLRSLADTILNSRPPVSPDQPGFWAHRAAHNLLDAVSASSPASVEPLQAEEQFYALPDWLRTAAASTQPLLPWLPLPPSSLLWRKAAVLPDNPDPMDLDDGSNDPPHCVAEPSTTPLDVRAHQRASDLKDKLLGIDSTSKAIALSHEIQQLVLDSGAGNQLTVLGLIEPWEADDETASVLLSHLASDSSLMPSHVLCSVVLPKLLVLHTPASRVLLSATVSVCKLNPMAAVEALLFPLVFRKEGINVVLCDALNRIIRECLHPSHISAFCQRLLCGDTKERKILYLPCHQDLISEELVWTEPLFALFQHILNIDVHLTPDTIDRLITVIDEMASKFSRSLKFGNFFLCFVTKCSRASTLDSPYLKRAVEKTDTFVTKSILSKLSGM